MQIPLEPAAGLLALIAAYVGGRTLLGHPAQLASDTRPPDSSAWTNPLGHDHRRIVTSLEASADYRLSLAMLGTAFAVQCMSMIVPSWSPTGWAGWLFTVLVPAAAAFAAYWLRPRVIARALEQVAIAQDRKMTDLSGNPAPSSEHEVQEMRVLLHRAVNDERIRKILQKRWTLAEIEHRSYSRIA